ncbi:MAG TPA: carboxylating nicotinate-nucleotide diphosphorylase [Bacteroidia bacterium]|nr:carboxylating nicotinate-nucleotide diphosphorylase [Bacteroidia bacterium]
MSKSLLHTNTVADTALITAFIRSALQEDTGDGDHTSLAIIPEKQNDQAHLLVKDRGIIAGVELAEMIFKEVDPGLETKVFMRDGTAVRKGDVVFEVYGSSRSILLAERLVLNCMQRMSAIATGTQHLVRLLAGLHTKVIDTRKTTPNFRYFEKWAVRIGGGTNHRFGLYDMILIKDNHVDYAGGIADSIRAAKDYVEKNKPGLEIEIEVRNMRELDETLEVGLVDRIMFDNFTVAGLRRAVEKTAGRFTTEASGGITAETIRDYAETGVDYISVGALTHTVRSLDLSLKAFRR